MMTPQLQEALEWVNHMRTGPLQGPPIDELPKGVPGHSQECVIARALKMGIVLVENVRMNANNHTVVIKHQPPIMGHNPRPVQRMIEQFDAGALTGLIDYESYRKMSPSVAPTLAQQALAKPFDKLMPQLAKFFPELHVTPQSEIEVSMSFDTQMHSVVVKNPGECPKAVQLTALMVSHMQKHLMEEMEKVLYPPMIVEAGKLVPIQPAHSHYYAPDWANMMQLTPEAPVKAPTEEPAVV